MTLDEFIEEFESNADNITLKLPCFVANEFSTTRLYFNDAVIDHKHKVIVFIGALTKGN